MTENKFDKMMRSYCNREAEQFELKEKTNARIKCTSVLAATLVLAILATILLVPHKTPENSFTINVSAADEVVDDSGNSYDQTHLLIVMNNCENVKRITATSDSGNISFMYLKQELISEEDGKKNYALVKHPDSKEDGAGVYVCDVNGEPIHIDCTQRDKTGNIIYDNTVSEYNDVIRYTVEFYDGTIKTQEKQVYLSDCDTPTYETSHWLITP